MPDNIVAFLGISLLIIGAISTFCRGRFEEQFDRSLFHGIYVPIYIGVLLGVIGITWLCWVSLIALAVLVFVHSKQSLNCLTVFYAEMYMGYRTS